MACLVEIVGSVMVAALVAVSSVACGGVGLFGTGAGSAATCATARGPFRVSGSSVLAADGARYIPYGMTVGGLQNPDYARRTDGDVQRIAATARDWCANTVRLQLRQASLIGVPAGRAAAFLSAIEREVSAAKQNHLVVVLNDQTESDPGQGGPTGAEAGPTGTTLAFWRTLAGEYGHDPQVIFDVFNEPRVQPAQRCGGADWQIWQHGGSANGHTYLGMQQLVTAVRDDGATNLVWVEGPCWASTLAQVAHNPISDGDRALVYDIHHPAGGAPHTPAEWNTDFGEIADHGIAPVVDGEWTNRSSGTTSNCWTDAPTAVPAYLTYLADHHIGLVAFQLSAGFMITSNTNLDAPTHIQAAGPSRWRCRDAELDQGAGADVLAWFQQHNRKP